MVKRIRKVKEGWIRWGGVFKGFFGVGDTFFFKDEDMCVLLFLFIYFIDFFIRRLFYNRNNLKIDYDELNFYKICLVRNLF